MPGGTGVRPRQPCYCRAGSWAPLKLLDRSTAVLDESAPDLLHWALSVQSGGV